MEQVSTKQRIVRTIDDLPNDTTIEEAIDRLTLLHKVSVGLQQSEEGKGMSQAEVEQHFRQRRSAHQH
jgi:hypothetical protein